MSQEPQYFSNDVLSRDDILGYDIGAPIPVEAFNGTVYVKPLSGDQRDSYEASNFRRGKGGVSEFDPRGARARLFVLCVVDKDTGKPMFNRADLDRIGKLPAAELDKVTDVAREASGLDADDEEAATEDFGQEDPAPVGELSSSALHPISG
jgi:hypothetical protein